MLGTFDLIRILNMVVYFLITASLFYLASKRVNHVQLGNILIGYWIFDTVYNAVLVISGPVPVDALPYQLCTLTMLMSAIAIRQKSEKLYQITIYTWISALVSMLTPTKNGLMPFFDYHTVVFYVSHGIIPLMQIYMTRVFRFKLYKYSFFNVLVFLLLYSFSAWIINLFAGTNFAFISHPEQENVILASLGSGFLYSVKLILIGVSVLLVDELIIKFVFRIKIHPYNIILFRFFSDNRKQ
jgi:hypothetical integral membrane protein (TIGR02206 family)